jgi:hypothetical protein
MLKHERETAEAGGGEMTDEICERTEGIGYVDAAARMELTLVELLRLGDEPIEGDAKRWTVDDRTLRIAAWVVASYFAGPDDDTINRDDLEVQLLTVLRATFSKKHHWRTDKLADTRN